MAVATDNRADLEGHFVSLFEAAEGHVLNGNNGVLRGYRRQAIERFAGLGLPKRKSETWKYTDIVKRLRTDLTIDSAEAVDSTVGKDVASLVIPGLSGPVAVSINGRYSAAHSDVSDVPAGVILCGLSEAWDRYPDLLEAQLHQSGREHDNPFIALNDAFVKDGVFLFVPRGVHVERPVQIIHVSSGDRPVMIQPRFVFLAQDNAALNVVQTSKSLTPSGSFCNVVTEIDAAAGAHINVHLLQYGSAVTTDVTSTFLRQSEASTCSIFTATFGGAMVRNNVRVLFDGRHCKTHLNGLFIGRGNDHIDNHTLVDHAQPDCESNELYKGILDDEATGIFNGKVVVRRDAQKTNAYQSSKSIVLTQQANMYAKPELEIYADDVKCSHGATTGHLDDEAMFYLLSRGIPRLRARTMLLQAFAGEVVDAVAIGPVKNVVEEQVLERIHD